MLNTSNISLVSVPRIEYMVSEWGQFIHQTEKIHEQTSAHTNIEIPLRQAHLISLSMYLKLELLYVGYILRLL